MQNVVGHALTQKTFITTIIITVAACTFLEYFQLQFKKLIKPSLTDRVLSGVLALNERDDDYCDPNKTFDISIYEDHSLTPSTSVDYT